MGDELDPRGGDRGRGLPGANGKIVFWEYNDEERDYGMKLVNPGGGGMVTLVRGSGSGGDPAMSPDGTRVAFSRAQEIFKINIANRKISRITNNTMNESNPAWSPDGKRIVFEAQPKGSRNAADLYIKRSDERGQMVNLTGTPNEVEREPAWSPDGREVAFYSYDPSDPEGDVVVMNVNTGQRRNPTDETIDADDSRTKWSPDGRRIAYESYDDAQSRARIVTMNASDGSDKRVLADEYYDAGVGGIDLYGPSYSPNGQKIAYNRAPSDYVYYRPQIFVMDAATGENKRLVYNAYNPGSGYPYGEVGLGDLDWGARPPR